MLESSGFKNITTFVDFEINNHNQKGERLFFVVKIKSKITPLCV